MFCLEMLESWNSPLIQVKRFVYLMINIVIVFLKNKFFCSLGADLQNRDIRAPAKVVSDSGFPRKIGQSGHSRLNQDGWTLCKSLRGPGDMLPR